MFDRQRRPCPTLMLLMHLWLFLRRFGVASLIGPQMWQDRDCVSAVCLTWLVPSELDCGTYACQLVILGFFQRNDELLTT